MRTKKTKSLRKTPELKQMKKKKLWFSEDNQVFKQIL